MLAVMHEMALCMDMIRLIEDQACRRAFRRVRRVRLEVGALAGIEVESLRFGFAAAARDTPAENAVLEIDQPPGRACCLDCNAVMEVRSREEPCPCCGSWRLRVRGGVELRVLELEVE